MKPLKLLSIAFAICTAMATTNLTAQESLGTTLNTILEGSESYENYKVISTSKLLKFKSQMQDSLMAYSQKVNSLQLELQTIKSELNELKTNYASMSTQLEESQAMNGQIAFLGLQMNKQTYNAVLWSFVALLASFIVVLYFRIKHVCAVVKRVKSAYSKIMDEYRTQRFQSVEKQMKLKRELQTMQNQLDNLRAVEETSLH